MVACPHCQAEDSLEVTVDAYTVYTFRGFDKGHVAESTWEGGYFRVDETDDCKVQCSQCGNEIFESDFLPNTATPPPNSYLVIKFGDEADRLIQHVAKALYHITAVIEYNEPERMSNLPTEVVLMTGDDIGLHICHRGEGGEPLLDQKLYVEYTDIASITII